MKILIVTLGSRGDVQPYVALGQGLQNAGHHVTLCTSSGFASFVTNNGLNYGYMNNELLQLIDSDVGRDAIENTDSLWGTIRTTLKLFKQVKPMYRQTLLDIWNTARSELPDALILGSKAAFLAESIADKLEIPLFTSLPFPQFVPSAQLPSPGFPRLNLGAWYNRLTYRIVRWAVGLYDDIPNQFRDTVLHLPPKPKHADILHRADGSFIPFLHSYSEHVSPRPSDWPDRAHVTGYWFLDPPQDWYPPIELQAFLDAGEPPIYIGFGSMAGRNPERLARVAIAALLSTNHRGILATGWGGLQADTLPESIFKLDRASHAWLFPRVSAVIHHGGAGTTAAGLRAGRPTLICPFLGDQPFWGRRVHTLGVGLKPIPQKQLTKKNLAQAICDMVSNTDMREKAEALGAKICAEDGIQTAIAIIESHTSSWNTQN